MTTTIPDLTKKIEELRNAHIRKVLNSIARIGIAPLTAIEEGCPVNFVLGTEETQKNVCVNYLDLRNCSKTQSGEAIHEAFWEEYTGGFGISLERPWPFTFQKNRLLFAQEIRDRLCNNVVFVLQPPKKLCVSQPVKDSSKTMDRCYEYQSAFSSLRVGNDGFSQCRGRSLGSGKKAVITQLTEIKTTHVFSNEEIIAVLVPEDLYRSFAKELNEWFPGKTIPVPYTRAPKSICTLPEILKILHGETFSGDFIAPVPDYENVIQTKILAQYNQFSLHTVRLHTLFDFTLRYVENISKNTPLLKQAEAEVLVKYPKRDDGWVIVHQTKTFQVKSNEYSDYVNFTVSLRFDNSSLREALAASKGQNKMSRYVPPGKETLAHFEAVRRGVSSISDVSAVTVNYGDTVSGLSCPTVMMLSYPPIRHEIVNNPKKLMEIGRTLEQKETKEAKELKEKVETQKTTESVETIQSAYRIYKAKQQIAQTKAALVIQKHYKRHMMQKDYCAYYELHKETQTLLTEHRVDKVAEKMPQLKKLQVKLYSRAK